MYHTSTLISSNICSNKNPKCASFIFHFGEIWEKWLVGFTFQYLSFESIQNLVILDIFVQFRYSLKIEEDFEIQFPWLFTLTRLSDYFLIFYSNENAKCAMDPNFQSDWIRKRNSERWLPTTILFDLFAYLWNINANSIFLFILFLINSDKWSHLFHQDVFLFSFFIPNSDVNKIWMNSNT